MKQLAIGQKIYYTGDMANQDGFGEIVEIETNDRFGITEYKIEMQDDEEERTMWISANSITDVYKGHCGFRFVTLEAYDKFRADSLEASRQYLISRGIA